MQLETPWTARERSLIHERCVADPRYREAVIQRAAEDRIFFCNLFLFTFDPRPSASQPQLPFILYDFQAAYVRRCEQAIRDQDDLLTEKSRAMGWTWLMLGPLVLWDWLFTPGCQILIGSRKEDLVDNRTLDSHFGKLEYMIAQLPGWFARAVLPGFEMAKHRQRLKLINPNLRDPARRGNSIRGESANAQFARSGRYTYVIFDEAAFWEYFQAAWRAAGMTTKTRLAGSTPNGLNAYGKLIQAPENQSRRVTLHWRLHPKYDDAWYEAECRRLVSPEDIAQELDISYTRSVHGRVYPSWDTCQFGAYRYEPTWFTYCSWDAGLDTVALIWWQRDPVSGQVRMLDCYHNRQQPIDFYVPFVTGELPANSPYLRSYTSDELAKITVHAGWSKAIHFGDPSLEQRDVGSGKSPADVLREHGIYVLVSKQNDFKTRKRVTDLGLIGLQVNCPEDGGPVGCETVDEAMRLARYRERNPDAQYTSDVSLPVHDASSHFRTAVEYFFMNLPPRRRAGRPQSYVATDAYAKII